MAERTLVIMGLAALSVLGAFLVSGCGGSGSGSPASSSPAGHHHPSLAVEALWPKHWCEVEIGMSRKEVVVTMDEYPTEEDSGKFPLIPYVHLNSKGEDVNPAPPSPAGSDTWENKAGDQFNAFYNKSLRVQQLDFNGPQKKIDCPTTRVH